MTIRRIDVRYAGAVAVDDRGDTHLCMAYKIEEDGNPVAEVTGTKDGMPGATAEIAAYLSIVNAMEQLISARLAGAQVRFYGDGLGIVNRMNGRWRVKTPALEKPHHAASQLAENFDDLCFTWVRREDNTEVDALARAEAAKFEPEKKGDSHGEQD